MVKISSELETWPKKQRPLHKYGTKLSPEQEKRLEKWLKLAEVLNDDVLPVRDVIKPRTRFWIVSDPRPHSPVATIPVSVPYPLSLYGKKGEPRRVVSEQNGRYTCTCFTDNLIRLLLGTPSARQKCLHMKAVEKLKGVR